MLMPMRPMFSMLSMFPCEQCGCCCRHVGKVPQGKGLALPDGACRHLDQATNRCNIYSSRPIFCRVDAYYDRYLAKEMGREEFYALNKAECARLQKACRESRAQGEGVAEKSLAKAREKML